MELNDFYFGLLLMLILVESMLLIGAHINDKKTETQNRGIRGFFSRTPILFWFVFIPATIMALFGIAMMIFSQQFSSAIPKTIDLPTYTFGLSIYAVGISVLFFVFQEYNNNKLMKQMASITEILKSEK
jgi:hypothetical protein